MNTHPETVRVKHEDFPETGILINCEDLADDHVLQDDEAERVRRGGKPKTPAQKKAEEKVMSPGDRGAE